MTILLAVKKGKHYYVSKHTPEIIVKKADIADLPMIVSFETLYLAVRENGQLSGHYHGLGASNTKKLYKVLSDPTHILKNNENGRINIISDIAIGKNNKSVISIELDVYKNVEGVKDTKHKGNYNLVITLFSAKDNYAENLKNKQEMSVLYEKKEDTHSSDLTSENMMLGNTDNVSSDNIIAEETQNVNTSEETVSVLNNQPESDTMSVKEDFEVGDILEFDGERWKCVNIDSVMIDFENVDKNAFQQNMSVILPYELFKEKTDYKVVSKNATPEASAKTEENVAEKGTKNEDVYRC